MATFSISPAYAAQLTNRATTPFGATAYGTTSPYGNASGTFLNSGVIQFLDSGLNVLSFFGFLPVGTVFWNNTISYSGSTLGSNCSFSYGANEIMFNKELTFNTPFGVYRVSNYNSTSGVLTGVLISGPGFSGSQNLQSATVIEGHASRSVDSTTGYVSFTNFPTVTPIANGTIEYVVLRDKLNNFGITFTAGDIGSGADVEINDRTLTTAQPWSLSGSIRVRLPMSYTYTS